MTQASLPPALPPRRSPTINGKTVVLAIAALAVLTFLVVIYFIWDGRRNDPYMNAPPVGAGAGQTGMYNEHMGKKDAPAPQPAPIQPH
jgi:hypothetical protein